MIDDLFFARYAEGGRGPDAYDCFGLFAEVQRRLGRPVPDYPTPAGWDMREAMILAGAAQAWLPLPEPEPWCAVTFRLGGYVCHLGVVLADGWHFLHAEVNVGVGTNRLDDLAWSERIAGFYRHG